MIRLEADRNSFIDNVLHACTRKRLKTKRSFLLVFLTNRSGIDNNRCWFKWNRCSVRPCTVSGGPNSLVCVATRMQGNVEEAGPLLARAATLAEKALGPEDSYLASLLIKRAEVLRKQVQIA